jgi:tetratricopeptide (TPR) repeat protein
MPQPRPDQAFDLALQHHRAGRLPEARQIYEQILFDHPNHSGALLNLAAIFDQLGQSARAVELIRRAVSAAPTDAVAHNALGIALTRTAAHDDAIAAFRQAIALKPDFAHAWNNLGNVLKSQGRRDEAIQAYRSAISISPDFAGARNNLAVALEEMGALLEAAQAYQQILAENPRYTDAHFNLGNTLKKMGMPDDAVAAYRQAIALKPEFSDAHKALGMALGEKGGLNEAIAYYRKAIALNPNDAEAHHNLSLALLLAGNFEQGWPEFEWRWKIPNCPSKWPDFKQSLWDGGDLAGRTILLYAEQGLGDTIQAIRYLPLVVQRGGRILIKVQSDLLRLLRQMPGVERWLTDDDPVPQFDIHCPLFSLPLAFQTRLETIPAAVPYLRADPALIQTWQSRLGPANGRRRVGLNWAGNFRFPLNQRRSIDLQQLAPLGRVPGVQFFGLQKGPFADRADSLPSGLSLKNIGPDLNDFADTAAVMACMDLIITTDTAVAHLAGALARPVWVMLHDPPDWRWMLGRTDTPWYPTMRLFRQDSMRNWQTVIAQVADALTLWTRNPA